jgi:NAD(P)-dependent dehydrogenase (short-subunit alcohol dehydrogenase family)
MSTDDGLAVVTGAASGIGAALAARLGSEGRKVVGVDVKPARSASAIAHDVAKPGLEGLLSDQNTYVTGARVVVDGGLTATF